MTSPTRNSTLVTPDLLGVRRASSIFVASTSMPTAAPVRPTSDARSKVTSPPPQPTSRQRMPAGHAGALQQRQRRRAHDAAQHAQPLAALEAAPDQVVVLVHRSSWRSQLRRTAPAGCAGGRRAGCGRARGGPRAAARSASRRAVKAASTAARALGGEPDDHPATVVGVGVALDVPAGAEPVDPVGHRAAGHQRLAQQAAGGELVRRAGASQRGEHVELPLLDAVRGERVAAGELEPTGEPADPAEDRDRGEVEVAALAAPGLEQLVHLVAHAAQSRACRES